MISFVIFTPNLIFKELIGINPANKQLNFNESNVQPHVPIICSDDGYVGYHY